MDTLTFVGMTGSLRRASRNKGLLRCCASHLPESVRMEIADISALPFYNEDLEKPQAVKDLVAQVTAADALVLACPEYNYSMAPALKNALDWLSREPDLAPLNGKPACLLGAGGGMGTARSQYQMRQTCVYLNLLLLNKPEFFSNAFSPAFDADGDLVDEGLIKQVAALMRGSGRLDALFEKCLGSALRADAPAPEVRPGSRPAADNNRQAVGYAHACLLAPGGECLTPTKPPCVPTTRHPARYGDPG